jgi:hypothetical protein
MIGFLSGIAQKGLGVPAFAAFTAILWFANASG